MALYLPDRINPASLHHDINFICPNSKLQPTV